jgi:hypothetical protein
MGPTIRRELRYSSSFVVCLFLGGAACSSGSPEGFGDGGVTGSSGSSSGSSSGTSGTTTTGSSGSTSSSTSGGGTSSSSSSSGGGSTSSSSSSGTTGTSSGESGGDGGGGTIGPNAGCKRGVAMTQSEAPSSAFVGSGSNPGIVWWYDWGLTGTGQAAGIEFDPMIWSPPLPSASKIASNAKYLLTFNEPDNSSQSNVSATTAASLWPQIESIATADGIPYIVSPGVASSVTWLQDFFNACTGCKVDYVAVHFYGCLLDTSGQWIGLSEYLEQFYQFNRPLWLTEFSCDATQTLASQTSYMQVAVPYLENNDHVLRYSWFSDSPIPNAMLTNGNGGPLNALGQLYVSLPASCK